MSFLNNVFSKSYDRLFFLSGPCAVESKEIVFEIAEKLQSISLELDIDLVFKASYRKANRSSINSFSGIGDQKALDILAEVKAKYNFPIVTDIHEVKEVESAAEVADILQIPAFLCRQTDLVLAAAHTGKIVNVKKGQFLSPESMKYVVEKIHSTGNKKIMLTERGTTFGYQDLVVDFRGIPIMQQNDVPVIMDCTHSLQRPNQSMGVTGGYPEHIETIAKAALAVGANGLFIETHPNPSQALSDGKNMLKLDNLPDLLRKSKAIFEANRSTNAI